MRTKETPTVTGDQSLAEDVNEVMEATETETGEKVKELRARLAAAVEAAKAAAQRLEEKTVAAAKATDRTIREHPYTSIGIAFGVGLLIGVLAARRKS